MQSAFFCSSHTKQGTPKSTKFYADMHQDKESSLLFVTLSDENANSHTPRPSKPQQAEIVKPACILDQTLESFTHLFFRRVFSISTHLKKYYDALLKENVKEDVVFTQYFKIIVNTNMAALELFLRLPYQTQVLRFLMEKTFDTRQFVKDLYFSIIENSNEVNIQHFHSFLHKAMKQDQFKMNRSITECILHILQTLISVLFLTPYDMMACLCPQLKHFQKTWTLAPNTPLQKEPNVHHAALTIVGFQNLEYIYYKKIAKRKQEEFFYNALFWSSCFQQQIEYFSYDYETNFALLPLMHLTTSLNRLKILASWKLKKPLTHQNSMGFWNSVNARQYVKSYYDEICVMSLHPLVEQSPIFLSTLIHLSVTAVQFLCINWDDVIDSHSTNECSNSPKISLNLFQPEYFDFLKLINHAKTDFTQSNNDDLIQLFNSSTSPICPTLILLQKTIEKSNTIQECITTLYERLHSLLIDKVLIPNLIPLISWNNLEYLSVDFWIHSIEKAQLTHQIYTLWETLASYVIKIQEDNTQQNVTYGDCFAEPF
jgi:hypothetical protein